MGKSRIFVIRRDINLHNSARCHIRFASGHNYFTDFCYLSFARCFGIKLKPSKSKRVKITITEE
jgi:hypothetical protein